ncbi:unnamed protein product [Amaranthus hypochondriacus]
MVSTTRSFVPIQVRSRQQEVTQSSPRCQHQGMQHHPPLLPPRFPDQVLAPRPPTPRYAGTFPSGTQILSRNVEFDKNSMFNPIVKSVVVSENVSAKNQVELQVTQDKNDESQQEEKVQQLHSETFNQILR